MSIDSASAPDAAETRAKDLVSIIKRGAQADASSEESSVLAIAVADIRRMLNSGSKRIALNALVSVGVEIALVRLLERYSNSHGENETTIVEEAIRVWIAISEEPSDQVEHPLEIEALFPMMVCFLAHAKSNIRRLAAQCVVNLK